MDALAVGIISNQKLIRKALFCLLLSLPISCRLCVAADADSVEDGAKQIAASKPDIVLIDCEGTDDVFDAIHKVRELSPATKPLLLADGFEERFAIAAVRAGAWGMVGKKADPELLRQALQKLTDGEMWLSRGTISMLLKSFSTPKRLEESPIERLEPREADVLKLLAQGCHNREIASRLFLSESTVKTYVKTIYRKLGVRSRVEATLRYTDWSNGTETSDGFEADLQPAGTRSPS